MAASDSPTVKTNDATAKALSAPKMRDTLLTVAIVLYPAFGAVGLIAAGLLFSNTGA